MEKENLKKQIDKLINDEFMDNCVMEDMTPTMSSIHHWGLKNMPIKIMKAIIKRNKE